MLTYWFTWLQGLKRTDQQPLLDIFSKRGQGGVPAASPSAMAVTSHALSPANSLMPSATQEIREIMMSRAAALGRGAMAQSALAAAAAVSSSNGLKRIFALAEQAKEGAAKKEGFRKLFNT